MKFGIDISAWQTNVDYAKAVQDGVEFAILRAGYATRKDKEFETHYSGFSSLGIPLGAYQYSYAYSVDGAKAEAQAMLEWLKGKNLNLPVFYDLEDSKTESAGKTIITEMALAWCDIMSKAGYKAGVYSNKYWFSTFVDAQRLADKGHLTWCAVWGKTQPDIPGLAVWQFGGETNLIRTTKVAGIGTCDQNYLIDESILTNGKEPAKTEPKTEEVVSSEKEVTTLTLPTLKQGSGGYFVALMQFILKMKGFNPGSIDGDFGKGTLKSLTGFQASRKLTVDGICDAKTWGQLL